MWFAWALSNWKVIVVGAVLVLCAGLASALAIQTKRLEGKDAKITEAEQQRDSAIDAHNALVDQLEKQRLVLVEREKLRQRQEKENAKLHEDLRKALAANKAWADAVVPVDVVGLLQTLSEAVTASGLPAPADSGTGGKVPD